jgi:ArsR family transcriptional regulator, arsenate/arsenite/antimonite-responsive transcriptional repressor
MRSWEVDMGNRALEAPACCPAVLAAPLADGEAVELARAFAALADPARLRLLSLVAAAPEVCACELVEPLGKSQPTVSHHLKVLFEAGLVTRQKRGTWVWYAVVPERLAALREALAGERSRGWASASAPPTSP